MANEYNRASIPEIETTYINKRFMDDLLLATQMVQFCTPADTQGMYKGDTCRWHHFAEWTEDTSVLSDAEATPTTNRLTQSGLVESTDGLMNAYGQYLEVGTFSLETAVVGTLDKIAKRAADAGARSMDRLAIDAAQTSTQIFYAGTTAVATSGDTSTAVAADFNYMSAQLNTVGANGFDHLNGMYGAVVHPIAASQLKGEATTSNGEVTWSDVNKHVSGPQEKIMKGEAGALFNVKIFESPMIETVNISDYENLVLAKDGLGCSTVDGAAEAKAKVIIKRPGPNDTYQPLDTFSTVGWKWAGVFKLLDSDRVIRYWSQKV
jgi:N4-gp56 family major capsid protein